MGIDTFLLPNNSLAPFLGGNEEKPEMEVNRTSFKTNLSLDEILSKMNSSDPRDSVDENEERQFFR